MNPIQFQISQLRAKNLQTLMEMLGITVFAIFFGAFAPSLIIGLFFSNQQMLEAPWFYQAIPVASLGLSILYTLYTLTTNIFRERMIGKLSLQLISSSDLGMELEEKEIKELEKMVDKTLKASRKPTTAIKKSSKQSNKRADKK